MCVSFKASAPGSLMLLGEHAVLAGGPALVTALNKRIEVTVTSRTDNIIKIVSALGHYETDLKNYYSDPVFRFVFAVLDLFRHKMQQGCEITIDSQIDATTGLGSSAAVTVATLAAMAALQKQKMTTKQLLLQSIKIIRNVQGVGSGADVAASVLGGVIAYRCQPLKLKKIPYLLPLTVVYSGKKTPTVDVIRYLQDRFSTAREKKIMKSLFAAKNVTTQAGIIAAENNDLTTLGKCFQVNQGIMVSLGLSNAVLESIVTTLQRQSSIHGAKISGSGLGDCVVGLGDVQENHLFSYGQNTQRLMVQTAAAGVCVSDASTNN